TWDSFRHKEEKIDITDIEGIDEKLSEFSGKIPTLQQVFKASADYQNYYGFAVVLNQGFVLKYIPTGPDNFSDFSKLSISPHYIYGAKYASDIYDPTMRFDINHEYFSIFKKFDTSFSECQMFADRFTFTAGPYPISQQTYHKCELLFPKFNNGIAETCTLPIKVNQTAADDAGNISLSSINTTFTTSDGKTITVTNGIITNIQ
ncbi:hypothetical protein, partial [Flavobacterium sp. UGB4466]|uniref:hypothetical protein n=1 Tax=Flavobacterium sp. UGB4466 TaxID=2730889 RepID=UPI00192BC887